MYLPGRLQGMVAWVTKGSEVVPVLAHGAGDAAIVPPPQLSRRAPRCLVSAAAASVVGGRLTAQRRGVLESSLRRATRRDPCSEGRRTAGVPPSCSQRWRAGCCARRPRTACTARRQAMHCDPAVAGAQKPSCSLTSRDAIARARGYPHRASRRARLRPGQRPSSTGRGWRLSAKVNANVRPRACVHA